MPLFIAYNVRDHSTRDYIHTQFLYVVIAFVLSVIWLVVVQPQYYRSPRKNRRNLSLILWRVLGLLQAKNQLHTLGICGILILSTVGALEFSVHPGQVTGYSALGTILGSDQLKSTFSYGPSVASLATSVTFAGSASGGMGPYSYTWSFGDGNTANGQTITHTFPSAGTYKATLTINDANAVVATSSRTIKVGNTPHEGVLHVNGTRIVDNNDNTVRLVGLNWGDYPNDVFPNRFNTGNDTMDVAAIRAAGFNVVNLIEEWGSLENSSSSSSFTYDSSAWNRLQERVSALTSQGVYVIVKVHADADTSASFQNLQNFLGLSQYCNAKDDFLSRMGDAFYSRSASADSTSGMAHLTRLWLRISNVTKSNPMVVGFDLLNEPWYCSNRKLSGNEIHDYWYSRISELTRTIRNNNDERIFFVEEAPMFEYYAHFKPYPDPNTVNSIHWYRGEYKTSGGSWTACTGDYSKLYDYFSDRTVSSNDGCSDQASTWILQAQRNYPNSAFMIGEFGDIYENDAGSTSQRWIQQSIQLFSNQKMAGWIYWSSGDKGTWLTDLGPTQKPEFQLSQTNPQLIVGRGLSKTSTFTITAPSWLSGTLNLAVAVSREGLKVIPDQLHVTISNGGQVPVGLTITTANSTRIDDYDLTLTASMGSTSHSIITHVRVTVPGDLDGDGLINIMDIGIMSRAFGSSPGSPNWDPRADLDNDGNVNIVDCAMLIVLYPW